MNVEIEPEMAKRIEAAVAASNGIVPISAESLVHMALDAFMEGLEGK